MASWIFAQWFSTVGKDTFKTANATHAGFAQDQGLHQIPSSPADDFDFESVKVAGIAQAAMRRVRQLPEQKA